MAYYGILWHTLSVSAIQRKVSFLVNEKSVNRYVADRSRGILWLSLSVLATQRKVSFSFTRKAVNRYVAGSSRGIILHTLAYFGILWHTLAYFGTLSLRRQSNGWYPFSFTRRLSTGSSPIVVEAYFGLRLSLRWRSNEKYLFSFMRKAVNRYVAGSSRGILWHTLAYLMAYFGILLAYLVAYFGIRWHILARALFEIKNILYVGTKVRRYKGT